MTVREFCEKALSNDLICFVDDILRGEPTEVHAAYRLLMDDDPDILDREVERFTYGKAECFKPRDVLMLQLAEDDGFLPRTYAEIEYDDFDNPEAAAGCYFDDMNYLRYRER